MGSGWLVRPERTTEGRAKAGKGFDVAHFHLDWQAELATCPQGQTSSRWSQVGERMEVVCARETCATCPVRGDCTRIFDHRSGPARAPTSRSYSLASAATRTRDHSISADL